MMADLLRPGLTPGKKLLSGIHYVERAVNSQAVPADVTPAGAIRSTTQRKKPISPLHIRIIVIIRRAT